MSVLMRLNVALVFVLLIGTGPPSLAETAPKKVVAGLPAATDGGDRRFAWVALGGTEHAVVINGKTIFFDRNGDGDVSGRDESKDGVLADRDRALFPHKATLLATIDGLESPIGSLNVEWEPTVQVPGVLVTTGTGDNTLELAFSPFAPNPDAAPRLRFGADERVFSVYGKPLAPHRAMGHEEPTLVVVIGRLGTGEKSFVSKWHKLLPENLNPTAEIVFNPGQPEEEKLKVVLNHRC